MQKSNKKILLLGSYGQNNLGDELLLEVYLKFLRSDAEIVVNSSNPKLTMSKFKVFSVDTSVSRDILKKIKVFFTSDIYFLGGGSILLEHKVPNKDDESVSRRPLLLLTLISVIAKILNKKVVMANIGVGPLYTKLGKFISRMILNQASYISVRDSNSLRLAQKLTNRNDIFYSGDAVLFGRKIMPKNYKKIKTIGIIPNWYVFPASIKVRRGNLKNLSLLVKEAIRLGFRIKLMPFRVNYGYRDDYWVSKEICRNLNMNEKSKVKICTLNNLVDIDGYIKSCDVVVSQRLHGVILSTILGIPVLAVNSDAKIVNYMTEIDSKMLFDVRTPYLKLLNFINSQAIFYMNSRKIIKMQQRVNEDFLNMEEIIKL